jgi:hypothetical protein
MDQSGIENKQGAATSSSEAIDGGLTEDPDSDRDK